MLTGTTITDANTGRRGSLLSRTATGGYVCQDRQGRFIVTHRKGGRRHSEGSYVLLRIDEVEQPVPAVRIGKGKFRCVDDPVWAGAEVTWKEAVVIEAYDRQKAEAERIAARAAAT